METLNEISVEAAYQKARQHSGNPLALELFFTRTYRENREADPLPASWSCLEVLFPAILQPIQAGDLLAGRIEYPLVGFSAEAMGLGYYCREEEIREVARLADLSPREAREVEEILAFWKSENTQARTRAAYPLRWPARCPATIGPSRAESPFRSTGWRERCSITAN